MTNLLAICVNHLLSLISTCFFVHSFCISNTPLAKTEDCDSLLEQKELQMYLHVFQVTESIKVNNLHPHIYYSSSKKIPHFYFKFKIQSFEMRLLMTFHELNIKYLFKHYFFIWRLEKKHLSHLSTKKSCVN